MWISTWRCLCMCVCVFAAPSGSRRDKAWATVFELALPTSAIYDIFSLPFSADCFCFMLCTATEEPVGVTHMPLFLSTQTSNIMQIRTKQNLHVQSHYWHRTARTFSWYIKTKTYVWSSHILEFNNSVHNPYFSSLLLSIPAAMAIKLIIIRNRKWNLVAFIFIDFCW